MLSIGTLHATSLPAAVNQLDYADVSMGAVTTVAAEGCLACCFASAFGVPIAELVDWLNANHGFQITDGHAWMNWDVAVQFPHGRGLQSTGSSDSRDDFAFMANQIGQGNVLIVKVDAIPSTDKVDDHWVLAYGRDGNDLSPRSFLAMDPLGGEYIRLDKYYNATSGSYTLKCRAFGFETWVASEGDIVKADDDAFPAVWLIQGGKRWAFTSPQFLSLYNSELNDVTGGVQSLPYELIRAPQQDILSIARAPLGIIENGLLVLSNDATVGFAGLPGSCVWLVNGNRFCPASNMTWSELSQIYAREYAVPIAEVEQRLLRVPGRSFQVFMQALALGPTVRELFPTEQLVAEEETGVTEAAGEISGEDETSTQGKLTQTISTSIGGSNLISMDVGETVTFPASSSSGLHLAASVDPPHVLGVSIASDGEFTVTGERACLNTVLSIYQFGNAEYEPARLDIRVRIDWLTPQLDVRALGEVSAGTSLEGSLFSMLASDPQTGQALDGGWTFIGPPEGTPLTPGEYAIKVKFSPDLATTYCEALVEAILTVAEDADAPAPDTHPLITGAGADGRGSVFLEHDESDGLVIRDVVGLADGHFFGEGRIVALSLDQHRPSSPPYLLSTSLSGLLPQNVDILPEDDGTVSFTFVAQTQEGVLRYSKNWLIDVWINDSLLPFDSDFILSIGSSSDGADGGDSELTPPPPPTWPLDVASVEVPLRCCQWNLIAIPFPLGQTTLNEVFSDAGIVIEACLAYTSGTYESVADVPWLPAGTGVWVWPQAETDHARVVFRSSFPNSASVWPDLYDGWNLCGPLGSEAILAPQGAISWRYDPATSSYTEAMGTSVEAGEGVWVFIPGDMGDAIAE
ncbi:MAG: hypothetical protein HON70_10325 [Lentisphaerae bacterium]|nr:hypothetical protein [Lentisphaerota bacterium]